MVQLDYAVAYLLPDAVADVITSGRLDRVFKFNSIRVPHLKGFGEREGNWREKRGPGFGLSGVIHVPQTHDGTRPAWFVVVIMDGPGEGDEGDGGSRSRFGWNGATAGLDGRSGGQKAHSYQCNKSEERSATNYPEN